MSSPPHLDHQLPLQLLDLPLQQLLLPLLLLLVLLRRWQWWRLRLSALPQAGVQPNLRQLQRPVQLLWSQGWEVQPLVETVQS